MKKALTIAVAGAALAATLSFVAAGGSKREPVTEVDALPATEIVATVRAMGLDPIGEPVWRGPYYVLHATDSRGIEMRVVADAQFGDILSVVPARPLDTTYVPRYERGPRIIHVPQGDVRDNRANDRASVNERDKPAAANDDAVKAIAPPAPRRVAPRPQSRRDGARVPQRRSDAPPPPPPGPPRSVLSAPPPPAEGPSPIYRTPRYNSSADSGDKFGAPRDSVAAPSVPPPPAGDTPPATRGD